MQRKYSQKHSRRGRRGSQNLWKHSKLQNSFNCCRGVSDISYLVLADEHQSCYDFKLHIIAEMFYTEVVVQLYFTKACCLICLWLSDNRKTCCILVIFPLKGKLAECLCHLLPCRNCVIICRGISELLFQIYISGWSNWLM